MEITKYLIMRKDSDDIEFCIMHEKATHGNIYTFYRSNSIMWTHDAKGELVLKVTDDGNGLKIQLSEKVKLSEMDYAHAEYLRVILNFIEKNTQLYNTYQMIDVTNIKTL